LMISSREYGQGHRRRWRYYHRMNTLPINGAVAARKELEIDVVIIARTMTLPSHGWKEATGRLRAAKQCRVDVGFLDRAGSKGQAAEVTKALDFPVLSNVISGVKMPVILLIEGQEMGYAVIAFTLAVISLGRQFEKA
jgi:2-methylisocitrate lyase-like PEP mutase family enzyme